MAENIKISVALAAYNGEKYIREQIISLLTQTMPPDEIIISDDTVDNSVADALGELLTTPGIVYLHNASPLGVCRNFEQAIKNCRGEYIFLCDQDDVWLPEKISSMYEILRSNEDIDGVFCNSSNVSENLELLSGTLWQQRKFSQKMQCKVKNGRALEVFCHRVTCSSHNIAFRRRVLDYVLPFPELSPFYPDTFLALCIASRSKWAIIPECLTLYRIHSSNLSNPDSNIAVDARRARKNGAASRNAQLAEIILHRNADKLSPENKKLLRQFKNHHHRRSIYSQNIVKRCWQVAFELLRGGYLAAGSIKSAIADILFAP